MMHADMRISYDRLADVLYITLGTPVPNEGEGVPNGVELQYSLSDSEPCGVKVIGFHMYEWERNLDGLAALVGKHLNVPRSKVEKRLAAAEP